MQIYTPEDYLDSATNIKDKIAKIDILISGLYTSAEKGAISGHIQEYHIDDGQSRIRTIYRSLDHVFDAIKNFERLRTLYVSKLGSRIMVLKDRNSI